MQTFEIHPAAKWAMLYTEVDPKLIAKAFDEDENALWDYKARAEAVLNEANEHRNDDFPELQKNIREFRDEQPIGVRKQMRSEYLENRLNELERVYDMACMQYAKAIKQGLDVTPKNIEGIEKEIGKVKMDLRMCLNEKEEYSGQDIVKAKTYPIENLLKHPVVRGMTLCPVHNEKSGSCKIKDNKFYCFGCGSHGDVIDLYQKIHNVDFTTAVKALS